METPQLPPVASECSACGTIMTLSDERAAKVARNVLNSLLREGSAATTAPYRPRRLPISEPPGGKSRYLVPGRPDIVIYRHNLPASTQRNGTLELLLTLPPVPSGEPGELDPEQADA